MLYGIVCAIIAIIIGNLIAKARVASIHAKSKNLLEKLGQLEGKPIDEIKEVIGEPNNVEIVDGSRILTWPGLQLLCTNDKKMMVKEVLQNIYK